MRENTRAFTRFYEVVLAPDRALAKQWMEVDSHLVWKLTESFSRQFKIRKNPYTLHFPNSSDQLFRRIKMTEPL